MIRTIILNGPPGCGKDTIGDLARDVLGANHIRYKTSLYAATAEHYGVDLEDLILLATDRSTKEEPSELLLGESPREALIHVSEDVIKPNYGDDYFGTLCSLDLKDGLNVISDGGFISELKPVVEASNSTLVIRLHREGCSFEGDSRDFMYEIDMPAYTEDVGATDFNVVEGKPEEILKLIKQFKEGELVC